MKDKGLFTNGITTSEENYYFIKGYQQAKEEARQELLSQICEFVKSEEFIAAWVHAKGVRFGEFLAQELKENMEV